ncbi:ribose 5-phosphate isomerase B [bacterium]|nr:ribose 5-phosphate isomerase B [bacterium]
MKISIGCDHGGFVLKDMVVSILKARGIEIVDEGTFSDESVDYPDFAKKVAEVVSRGKVDRGILICGTGLGMSITANRFKGVRAAVCNDLITAKYSRLHNDSNILCMGARVIDKSMAEKIVNIWLDTEFEGGRHQRRVDKIE